MKLFRLIWVREQCALRTQSPLWCHTGQEKLSQVSDKAVVPRQELCFCIFVKHDTGPTKASVFSFPAMGWKQRANSAVSLTFIESFWQLNVACCTTEVWLRNVHIWKCVWFYTFKWKREANTHQSSFDVFAPCIILEADCVWVVLNHTCLSLSSSAEAQLSPLFILNNQLKPSAG